MSLCGVLVDTHFKQKLSYNSTTQTKRQATEKKEKLNKKGNQSFVNYLFVVTQESHGPIFKSKTG